MKHWIILSLWLGGALCEDENVRSALKSSPTPNVSGYINSSTPISETTTSPLLTTTTTPATALPPWTGSNPQYISSHASYSTITLSQWSYTPTSTPGAQPTCKAGLTATYFNTIYPTVTSTVEVTYSVAVKTSSRLTVVTESPLPACAGIVISVSPAQPSQMPTSSLNYVTATVTGAGAGAGAGTVTRYYPTYTSNVVAESFTATVVVTKKTTVPFVPTGPASVPITVPTTTAPPNDNGGSGNKGGGGGGGGAGKGGTGGGGASPGDTTGNHGSNDNSPGSGGDPPVQAIPGNAEIGGETIYIGPHDVTIGTSTIPLPTPGQQSPPRATIGDKTFTVLQSQVVGQGTTYNIPLATSASTITQSSSTVTISGIVVTVGPLEAVISGTRYRIGIPSNPQTISVDGQVITLNSDGVVFPSTTLSPAMTVAIVGNHMYRIVIVSGITISVDATEAIISGTTIMIGQGAIPASTLTLDGQIMTAGPAGLIIGGTTVSATSLDRTATSSPTAGAGVSTSTPEPTSTDGKKDSAHEDAAVSCRSLSQTSIFALLSTMLLSSLMIF